MANYLPLNIFRHVFLIFSVAVLALAPGKAGALALDTYAEKSVLADGKWVKISVEESGLHIISNSTLRSWGFSDPARVRVYGYGGRRIAESLSAGNYTDDLPPVLSEATPSGLVFYAAGPDEWKQSTGSYYHGELNPYTSEAYYFLTEDDAPAQELTTGHPGAGAGAATTAQGRAHHEREISLAGSAGPLMVGEDFRSMRTQQFNFSTPCREGDEIWFECQFVHRHYGDQARLSFEVDGTAVSQNGTDAVPATSDSHYYHFSSTVTRHKATTATGDAFRLGVTYTPKRNAYIAALDYISVNYTRRLELDPSGQASFWSSASQLSFKGDGDVRIWDVTDPAAAARVNTEQADGHHRWSVSYSGLREYSAWRPGASLPSPKLVGRVANQNLHDPSITPEMVIFTPPALLSAAERIAALHRDRDGMEVAVVKAGEAYNEFSSGAPDVSGLRKYLKMLYDRGKAQGKPLKYCLLMGRPSLDFRNVLATTRQKGRACLPAWVTTSPAQSYSDNISYCSDDFIAALDDNSGIDKSRMQISVAIGRMPASDAAEAASLVDKLYDYVDKSKPGVWRNRMMVIADDEDKGQHLQQADTLCHHALASPGSQHILNKVYLDYYEEQAGVTVKARDEIYTALDNGLSMLIFTGHASAHGWTGEGILSYNDLTSKFIYRNVPFFIAATCDFMRWDDDATISGAELLYQKRYGGAIGMLSAVRPVLVSNNADMVQSVGRHMFDRDGQGRYYPMGELVRRAKNDIRNSKLEPISDTNRLRYQFMGDPAMRLVWPDNMVAVNTINGRQPVEGSDISIGALENVEIEGQVNGPDGSLLANFNGTVNIDLYDALESRVTLGRGGEDGVVSVFDEMGSRLYSGAARVSGGRFKATVAMPAAIADNYREAAISLYAISDDASAQAIGVNRNFYVSGYCEPAEADTIAPVIEYAVLNSDDFADGAIVNSTPLLMARASDNKAINLSKSGVGYQMCITVDGQTTYSDVADYYTPDSDGSPSGTISYRIPTMPEGPHTVRLRVFDTAGNMAEKTMECIVNNAAAPKIYEVFTDASPATTLANFYVRHDRPDEVLTVTVHVYDLSGKPVWSSSTNGMSDSDVSTPVTWNLLDANGRRVNRGIYLYRATVTADGENYETAVKRIAVTGR